MSVDKNSVLKKLRESDAIYVLMSDCTRMPFVVCDPETYDDEVFVFFSEEDDFFKFYFISEKKWCMIL